MQLIFNQITLVWKGNIVQLPWRALDRVFVCWLSRETGSRSPMNNPKVTATAIKSMSPATRIVILVFSFVPSKVWMIVSFLPFRDFKILDLSCCSPHSIWIVMALLLYPMEIFFSIAINSTLLFFRTWSRHNFLDSYSQTIDK